MLSRLHHHEVIWTMKIAVIFIIFGSQRHLKSGLSCSFMIFGLFPLDFRIMCGGGVLYVLFYILSDLYRCLWRHLKQNHRNHCSEASWYNVVMYVGSYSIVISFFVDDTWSAIVPHCWNVVSTSTSPNHRKKLNNYSFYNL